MYVDKYLAITRSPYIHVPVSPQDKLKVYIDDYDPYGEEYWFGLGMFGLLGSLLYGLTIVAPITLIVGGVYPIIASILVSIFMIYITANESLYLMEHSYKSYENKILSTDEGQLLLATILANKTKINPEGEVYLNRNDMKIINSYCNNIRKGIKDKDVKKLQESVDKHLEKYNLNRNTDGAGKTSSKLKLEKTHNTNPTINHKELSNNIRYKLEKDYYEDLMKAIRNYSKLNTREQYNLNEILETLENNVKRMDDVRDKEREVISDNIKVMSNNTWPTIKNYASTDNKSLIDSSELDRIYITDKYGE